MKSRLVAALMLSVTMAAGLAGCVSEPPRVPATYTVRKGDTLYSIAWRHGLDYRELAQWNGIGSTYLIRPGQLLRLTAPADGRARAPVAASPQQRGGAAVQAPVSAPLAARVDWAWPTHGGSAQRTERPNGGLGLTISGHAGQEILAAGPGRVVYTGAGLLGYGQLVIIKHNEVYLSAYGHTASVLVSEGDDVERGQRIATMGDGPGRTPALYFEIRANGRPTDPLQLLPPRG